MKKQQNAVLIKFDNAPLEGKINVKYGVLKKIKIISGTGDVKGNSFSLTSAGEAMVKIMAEDAVVGFGGGATIITVALDENSFSFFLRDCAVGCPIFVPRARAVVTAEADPRSYRETVDDVNRHNRQNHLQKLAAGPEENFIQASQQTRSQKNEIWLGLSRDIRIFHFDANWAAGNWGEVRPYISGHPMPVSAKTFKGYFHPDTLKGNLAFLEYGFVVGRGSCCSVDISRHLENGCLPILRGVQIDDDVHYKITAFASPLDRPLTAEKLQGTHYLVADYHSTCHVFTAGQEKQFQRQEPLFNADPTMVCLFVRIQAVNTANVPRYAFFKAPMIIRRHPGNYTQDFTREGLSLLQVDDEEKVLAATLINGAPMRECEQAILIAPGGIINYDMLIPHSPVPLAAFVKIKQPDFRRKYHEVKAFWENKLKLYPSMNLPERRLNDMVKAGMLHLEMIAYGQAGGPLIPSIGHFAALAVESAPIMLFWDVIGRHDLARRAIEFYLAKQHADGRMHNYANSQSETAPVLYVIGEHFRFTRDHGWFKTIIPKVLKSCEYMLKRRRKNMTSKNMGLNYGMFNGGVADNDNPCCFFMSNGYAYVALKRTVEWLREVAPDKARELAAEAEEYRRDIRKALFDSMERSPVVPLADGTWRSSVSPEAEGTGNYSLYCDGKPRLSHGVFHADDILLGPLWLVFQEVFDPDEPIIDDILDYQTELFMKRNLAYGQPYHSRHAYIHLRRGEIKAFLKAYYIGQAAMSDRETYTWNEHTHGGGKHKTHEEAWFLMQTRWMLLLEEGKILSLLKGIPRAWMEDGKRVTYSCLPSYFGHVSLDVQSRLAEGIIEVEYSISGGKLPEKIRLRIPHPDGLAPASVTGGIFRADTESVEITPPNEMGKIVLRYF